MEEAKEQPMRINLNPEQYDGQWRSWFAWHPVFTEDALVWLERVERRWDSIGGIEYAWWEYRANPNKKD